MLKIVFYSCPSYEQHYLQADLLSDNFEAQYVTAMLSSETVSLANNAAIVSVFTNDDLSLPILEQLKRQGCQLLLLRCAGYNHICLEQAKTLGLTVCHVPEYSPYSIAEFAVMMTLNLLRHSKVQQQQMSQHDFRLDNIVGESLHGKTVGIMGTGHIGYLYAKLIQNFGCKVMLSDPQINGMAVMNHMDYYAPQAILEAADIISLHCPLNNSTQHMVNEDFLKAMKSSAYLINTARGGLVDSHDLLAALLTQQIAGYAGDVYEFEQSLFFKQHDVQHCPDQLYCQLLNLPNVILSPHCAYLTTQALTAIAKQTWQNCQHYLDHDDYQDCLA